MNYDLPPPDSVMETLLGQAELITQPPRQAVLDVCPNCSYPITIRHGHAVCDSAICKGRILEGCCGE